MTHEDYAPEDLQQRAEQLRQELVTAGIEPFSFEFRGVGFVVRCNFPGKVYALAFEIDNLFMAKMRKVKDGVTHSPLIYSGANDAQSVVQAIKQQIEDHAVEEIKDQII